MNDEFNRFSHKVYDFLELNKDDTEAGGPCIEILWDIYDGKDNLNFDFEELRLTKDLLLGAILLAKWKSMNYIDKEP